MNRSPLGSLSEYSLFVAEELDRSTVERSTVMIWSESPYTGIAEGEVFFNGGLRLRIRQELDFDARLITSYGYEIYKEEQRLFWYDDFPHPNDSALAVPYPHHKHLPPDIKHNRVPAPQMSFTQPNLPVLIREVEELISG
jgi:hypothetical protein